MSSTDGREAARRSGNVLGLVDASLLRDDEWLRVDVVAGKVLVRDALGCVGAGCTVGEAQRAIDAAHVEYAKGRRP
jgi:hypothetical protein